MMNEKHHTTTPRLRFPEFRTAPAWETKPLGTLCTIANGKSNAQDHEEKGIYPLFDRSEEIKKSSNYLFEGEAVIIPGEGMRFVPRYFDGKFALHQRAYALMDFICSGKFIFYEMDFFQDVLLSKAVLSTVRSLRLPIIKEFVIRIPPAIKEQTKIADCLSSIDALIAEQERKIESSREHKKGLMQQLFPASGESLPRLRFLEFCTAPAWEIKPLGEVCVVTAGQSPKGEFYNKAGKGLPLYQGKKEFTERFLGVPDTWTSHVTRKALAGDILMSVRAPVGPINESTETVCIGRGLASIRAKEAISKDFLWHYLLMIQPSIAGKEGAIFASIDKTEIEAIPILLPPLAEQQKIGDCLSSIGELTAEQMHKLELLREHKKGLMQQLFPFDNEVMR